jgi:type IV pilus assembly protein PilB
MITRRQLQQAFTAQKQLRAEAADRPMCELYLSSVLINLGFVSEDDMARLLAVHWQMPIVELSQGRINDDLIELLPGDLARRFCVFPLDKVGKVVILAVSDPTIEDIMTYIAKRIGFNVKPAISLRSNIMEFINYHYPEAKAKKVEPAAKETKEEEEKPAAEAPTAEEPDPKRAPEKRKKPAVKEAGDAVKALPVQKGKFAGLAEISLDQQAETWIAAKMSVEKEVLPVDPAMIALLSRK